MLNNKYLFYQSGGKYYLMNGGGDIWDESKEMVKDEAKEFGKKVALNGITMMLNKAGIDPESLSNNPEAKEELVDGSKKILALGKELAKELDEPLKEFTEQVTKTTEDVGGQFANSLSQTVVNLGVDAITPVPGLGTAVALLNTANQTATDMADTYGKSMESYTELSKSLKNMMDTSAGVIDRHSEGIKSSVVNIKDKLDRDDQMGGTKRKKLTRRNKTKKSR